MADDVFSQIEGDVVQGHDQSPLVELVGEGKKFKSLEDLAVGKQEADKHIEQLEGELKLLREQMGSLEEQSNKAATVSDLVAAVRNANKPDVEGNQPVSEEQLQEMVASIMDGRTEAQTRAANYQEANQSVLDKFNGDVEAARTYTAERAKQLHMTAAQLKALGEESPSAFKQLMDVKPSTGSQSTQAVPGAVQTESMAPRMDAIDGHHTKAYYDKLKAEIGPAKFWNDTKIQGQYMKDAVALGDRFNQ